MEGKGEVKTRSDKECEKEGRKACNSCRVSHGPNTQTKVVCGRLRGDPVIEDHLHNGVDVWKKGEILNFHYNTNNETKPGNYCLPHPSSAV